MTTTANTATSGFEDLYLESRAVENRMYTDQEVACLPIVPPNHEHANEWRFRRRSVDRLTRYLGKKNQALNILEIGTGNGWLSAKLAGIPRSNVTGLDVNALELGQAKRVFAGLPNLNFILADPFEAILPSNFDTIVFAASFQYFYPANNILNRCLELLRPGGEIHIIDTCFYKKGTLEKARQRSLEYYEQLGIPGMAAHYHHHDYNSISGYSYELLKNPESLMNRLREPIPFPWVRIKTKA